jgi:hypothetical protein
MMFRIEDPEEETEVMNIAFSCLKSESQAIADARIMRGRILFCFYDSVTARICLTAGTTVA